MIKSVCTYKNIHQNIMIINILNVKFIQNNSQTKHIPRWHKAPNFHFLTSPGEFLQWKQQYSHRQYKLLLCLKSHEGLHRKSRLYIAVFLCSSKHKGNFHCGADSHQWFKWKPVHPNHSKGNYVNIFPSQHGLNFWGPFSRRSTKAMEGIQSFSLGLVLFWAGTGSKY